MPIIQKARRFIKLRVADWSRILLCRTPSDLWLYKHRFLRTDANARFNDAARRQFHIDRYRFAADYLQKLENPRLVILDSASGTGYGSDILKSARPQQIIGVDISPEAVKYATRKYSSEHCRFLTADVTNMSGLTDKTFDAVVSFETIEHIKEPLAFLKEVHRLLKENGTLIISTPNKWGPTRDHQFDYDYDLFCQHLNQYFRIESMHVQNSGCMDLWVNRNAPKRLVKATPAIIEEAECFVAVCRKD